MLTGPHTLPAAGVHANFREFPLCEVRRPGPSSARDLIVAGTRATQEFVYASVQLSWRRNCCLLHGSNVVCRTPGRYRLSLVVVGYPAVSKAHFDWMQSIRLKHDELYYTLIDPHFTFVLHDRLYEGLLAQRLRLDLPFIPHIAISNTNANANDPKICKQLADDLNDDLNDEGCEVEGFVEALDVVSLERDQIATVERVPLES